MNLNSNLYKRFEDKPLPENVLLINTKFALSDLLLLLSQDHRKIAFIEVARRYNYLYKLVKENIEYASEEIFDNIEEALWKTFLWEYNFKYKFSRLKKSLPKK